MKSQRGMAALETVLLLVIAAILAFTGWYVYKAHQNSNKSLSSAASASQNQSAARPAAGAPASSASDQSLQSDLDGIDSAQNQAAQDNSSAGSAVNDQQNEISVPTN